MFITAALIAQLHGLTMTVPTRADSFQSKVAQAGMILVADDPHGPDPHGDDPHDEQHDSQLPANQERKANKAPTDPYGGQLPR